MGERASGRKGERRGSVADRSISFSARQGRGAGRHAEGDREMMTSARVLLFYQGYERSPAHVELRQAEADGATHCGASVEAHLRSGSGSGKKSMIGKVKEKEGLGGGAIGAKEQERQKNFFFLDMTRGSLA